MSYLFVRLSCAFLVGSLLSMSGSLIQLSTRNILSSPSTLGMDGLAVLAFLIFHTLGLLSGEALGPWSVLFVLPLFIALGSFYPRFVSRDSRFDKVLLVGITLNLLIGALFSLWQFLFLAFNYPFPSEMWFGHFRFASLESLMVMAGIQSLGFYFLRIQFPSLMLFSLGPQIARNWGLETNRLLRRIFIFAAVATAAVVGLFGAFTFLALVFPILSRRLWFRGGDLKGELLMGSFANGLFLMFIDLLCYQFPLMGAEVPVGLIMSAAGALSLIVLIWQGHKD